MRTLIVGGLSPLGRAIVVEFRSRGWETTRTSRSGVSGTRAFDVLDHNGDMLLDENHPDAVIYLANPDQHGSASDALVSFANACARRGVSHFLFASSAAVYGTGSDLPHRESDVPAPESEYGRQKLDSELALLGLSTTGMDVVIARIFNVFGPGFDQSLVNRLGLPGETRPRVYDSETFVRDYIHSSDVARAVASALVPRIGQATVVNIGSGRATSNRALLDLLPARAVERVVRDDRPVHSHSVADVSRARALWNFDAQVTPEAALADPTYLTRSQAHPSDGVARLGDELGRET